MSHLAWENGKLLSCMRTEKTPKIPKDPQRPPKTPKTSKDPQRFPKMDTQKHPGKPWKCSLNSALPTARGHVTVYRYVFCSKWVRGVDDNRFLEEFLKFRFLQKLLVREVNTALYLKVEQTINTLWCFAAFNFNLVWGSGLFCPRILICKARFKLFRGNLEIPR